MQNWLSSFFQKVRFCPICKHASAQLCITLQSVQVRGANIPKFGGREHNFVHNRAGVLLPPPRSVIKEFHQGNIFFSEGEKISGKYCPQSPIIGPLANLFRRGAVFAQREYWRDGGEEGEGGIRAQNLMSAQWFVVSQINIGSFLTDIIQELSLRSHLAKRGPWSLIFTLQGDLHRTQPLTELDGKKG